MSYRTVSVNNYSHLFIDDQLFTGMFVTMFEFNVCLKCIRSYEELPMKSAIESTQLNWKVRIRFELVIVVIINGIT